MLIPALVMAAAVPAAFVILTAVFARGSAGLVLASRVMAWLTLAAAIILPLTIAAAYFGPDTIVPGDVRINQFTAGQLRADVPLNDRLLAFACGAVPLGIAVWALLTLRRVFELFATREIFSPETSKALSTLSLALLLNVVAAFVAHAPSSYFLTRSGGVGPKGISLTFGSDDLIVLLLAAAAAIVARVLSEATRVADENAKFV